MASVPEQKRALDPSEIVPAYHGRPSRERHSVVLVVPCLVFGILVLLATAFEGTLGTLGDVRWVSDVKSVFVESVPLSPATMPLLRDVTDISLFVLLTLGLVMLHRQWQHISNCLPELRRLGTIVARPAPRPGRLAVMLRLTRVAHATGDSSPLDMLERQVGRAGPRLKAFLVVVILGVGLALAVLLRVALESNVLQVFVPTELSPAEQEEWLRAARESWWASSSHSAGYILHSILVWLGMSLIVAYNVMGLITVYMALRVYLVVEPTADWLNRDGHFGWLPVARIYRSVYLTIVLFCAVVSVLVVLLGGETPIAIAGLVLLYVLLVPVYTMLPWLVFRRIEARVREHRQNELAELFKSVEKSDVERTQAFVAEFARCRDARIRPMSLRRLQLSGFASVVLLPIALTIVQVILPLGLDR